MTDELMLKVRTFQAILIIRATGGSVDEEEYVVLRKELISDPTVKHYLPDLVATHRSVDSFWQFIKYKFAHYWERKVYLEQEFDRVFRVLEGEAYLPSDASITEVLEAQSFFQLKTHWQKGMDRKESDPEGAVTIARTLIRVSLQAHSRWF